VRIHCSPYNVKSSDPSLCHDEYGQSFGCSTNPCFTGLIQQYRTHAANAVSSLMWCSQNRFCQMGASLPRGSRPCRSGFRPTLTRPPCAPHEFWGGAGLKPDLRKPDVNRALIAAMRTEYSASPSGNVHTQCIWSGKTTHASMRKGRSAFVTRTASRKTATCSTKVCAPRSAKATVKNKAAPGRLGRMYFDMGQMIAKTG